MVGADPAGGHDHRLGAQLELAHRRPRARLPARDRARLEHGAGDAGERRRRSEVMRIDAVAELQRHQAPGDALAHAALERLDHARPGAPGDVEARHGVPVLGGEVAAALGPAGGGHEAHSLVVEPLALLAGGELDVRLRPLARPRVLGRGRSRRSRASPGAQSSGESWIRTRRCSGVSTRNRPPSDQNAWPPSEASGSWSSRITRRPALTSSAVATSPASPAPTTMTSASFPATLTATSAPAGTRAAPCRRASAGSSSRAGCGRRWRGRT